MVKKIISIVMVAVLLLIFVGCRDFPKKQVRVMFIPKSAESSFWEITINGFNTAIIENNAEGVVLAPKNEEDYAEQIRLIEMATKENYDAIILSSIDYERPIPAIKKAIESGVNVVIVDSDVNLDTEIMVKVSTNNYEAGKKMANQIISEFGTQGKVGLIMFNETTQNGNDRLNGFISEIEKYNDMKIVAKYPTTSNIDDAKRQTLLMLREHPEIEIIAVFNELTTIGVGKAIEEKNRNDIYSIGFDNNVPVIDYLERGVFDALVIQNQFAMGYLACEYAIKQSRGEQKEIVRVNTGVNIVTTENMYDEEIQRLIFVFDTDKLE